MLVRDQVLSELKFKKRPKSRRGNCLVLPHASYVPGYFYVSLNFFILLFEFSTWDSSCQFTLRKKTADCLLPSFKDGAKSGGLRCTTAIKNGSLFFSVFILIHFFTNADWNEFFSCRIFGLFSVQRERRRNQPSLSQKINAGKIIYPQNLLLGKGKQRTRCVGWNLSRYFFGNWIVLYYAANKVLK